MTERALAQGAAAPTHADILRGEYGRYRANNDLLYYHLDVRVDPNRKVSDWQHSDALQDVEGRQSYPTRSSRSSQGRQDRVFRNSKSPKIEQLKYTRDSGAALC
jgi:hypothetical protein